MSNRQSRLCSALSRSALVLLALGSLGAAPGSRFGAQDPGSRNGELLLRSGRFSHAAQAFGRVLARDPDNLASNFGLGVALSNLGRCEQALVAFDKVRDQPVFRADGFLAEAQCALRKGDVSGSLERLDEAVAIARRRPDAWFQYVMVLNYVGRHEDALEALDTMAGFDREGTLTQLARARIALGTDEYWYERMRLDDKLRTTTKLGALAQAHVLEGRALLLDGAPAVARDVLMKAVRMDLRSHQFAGWRAEACRRAGDMECAQFAMNRPALKRSDRPPINYAFHARVETDAGDLAAAQRELDLHPDPADPEYVASAWYLARARGQDTTRLEALYEIVRRPDSGDLSLLIPRSTP